MEVTLSVIKADIGGYVGHSSSHPDVIQKAKEKLEQAKSGGLLTDYHVTVCGDDLQLIMTHQRGWFNGDGAHRVHARPNNIADISSYIRSDLANRRIPFLAVRKCYEE